MNKRNTNFKIICVAIVLFAVQLNFAKKKISAIFDSGWSNYDYTNLEFKNYYNKLKALGINTVVYQFSLVNPDHEYYPSSLAWATYPNHSGFYGKVNQYSQEVGLDVYLALYYEDTNEWWSTVDDAYLIEQANRCIDVFTELETLYGSNSRVKGYYIPHEIARYYWQNSSDLDRLVTKFLKPVTDHIHANSTKKVIASPFFNVQLETPGELEVFIYNLFSNWHPDIVAMQDGIGVEHATLNNVGKYLSVVSQKAEHFGIEYWTNIELFDYTNDDDNAPADISRIIKQIEVASPYSAKLVAYDNYTLFTGSLYNDLLNYQTTNIVDNHKTYTASLLQNYPNPFNPNTTIYFTIPTQSYVELAVYNIIGEKIVVLVSKTLNGGEHKINFNVSNLSSGIYFYKIKTDGFVDTKKMIILK